RTLSTPAHYAGAEGASHIRHPGADAAIGVDTERFSLNANPDRRLPVPVSQPLHFVRDVPQRAEDQTPGKLRGRMRRGLAGRRDHHPVLSAGADVDVSCAAPGLADEP